MVKNEFRSKQKVPPLSVSSIKELTDTAEDVARTLFTIKKEDAPLVDLALDPKWEDMTDGPRRSALEEVKVLEEWDIWKIFLEELKMDSDLELPPSLLKEKPNDQYDKISF